MPSLFSFIIKLIVYPLSTVNIFTCTLLISISFILPTYLTWLFPTCAYRRLTYTPHRLAITMLIKLATSGEEQSIEAQVLTRRKGCWHMVRVARPRILTLLIRQGAESNASQFRRIPFRADRCPERTPRLLGIYNARKLCGSSLFGFSVAFSGVRRTPYVAEG